MVRQRPIWRSRAGGSTATHGGQAFRKRWMLRQRQSRGDCSDSFWHSSPPVSVHTVRPLRPPRRGKVPEQRFARETRTFGDLGDVRSSF